MGHLVNPISARLGIVRVWNSTWVSNKGLMYSYLLAKDLELQKSLDIFFNKTNNTDYWAIIFDRALIFRTSKRVYVFIVLYSWKFFGMVEKVFKSIFDDREDELANTILKFTERSKVTLKKIKKRQPVSHKKRFWSIKHMIRIYPNVLLRSFRRFKYFLVKDIRRSLIDVIFFRFFHRYNIRRTRCLFFIKVLKDFLSCYEICFFLLSIFRNAKYLVNTLPVDQIFRFYRLLLLLSQKLYFLYEYLQKITNFVFFGFLKRNFFSKMKRTFISNIFHSKKKETPSSSRKLALSGFHLLYYFKLFKGRINRQLWRFSTVRKRQFAIKVGRHKLKKKMLIFPVFSSTDFFFNIYLKNIVTLYNKKIEFIKVLLKRNFTWWVFLFIKVLLRKQLASYYGKRLWYIRSYVNYFFAYKGGQSNMNVFFLFPSFIVLTAKLISYIIRIRLTQKYSLGEILNKFVGLLNKQPELIGYRITCHGRFTRRQRASHKLVKSTMKYKDKLLLNTFTGIVDYAYIEEPLKYGMCGIRIWLVKNKRYAASKYRDFLFKFTVVPRYKRSVLYISNLCKLLRYLRLKHKAILQMNGKSPILFSKKRNANLRFFLRKFNFKVYTKVIKGLDILNISKPLYSSHMLAEHFKKKFFLLY